MVCFKMSTMIAAVSTAVEAWHLSMAGRFRLLEQWCTFVQVFEPFLLLRIHAF